jgi:hypothetical protein
MSISHTDLNCALVYRWAESRELNDLCDSILEEVSLRIHKTYKPGFFKYAITIFHDGSCIYEEGWLDSDIYSSWIEWVNERDKIFNYDIPPPVRFDQIEEWLMNLDEAFEKDKE